MKHKKLVQQLLSKAISDAVDIGEHKLISFDSKLFSDMMYGIVTQREIKKSGNKAGDLYCLMRDFYETQIKEILADDRRRPREIHDQGDAQEVQHT